MSRPQTRTDRRAERFWDRLAGSIAFALASQVKTVHGIDISGKMIAAARRRATERGAGGDGVENVHFAQAMLFDAHLKPASFDAILVLNTCIFCRTRHR